MAFCESVSYRNFLYILADLTMLLKLKGSLCAENTLLEQVANNPVVNFAVRHGFVAL